MKRLLRCAAGAVLLFSAVQAPAQTAWTHLPTSWATIVYATEAVILRAPSPGVVWGVRSYSFPGGPGNKVYTYQLYTSSDGGQNIQYQQIATSNGGGSGAGGADVLDMWAVDATHAWVVTSAYVGGARKLLRTTTGGTAPAELVGAAPAGLRLVRFFSATSGIAVADAGTGSTWPLFQTTDGGTTWQPIAGTPAAATGDVATNCAVLGNNLWITTVQGNVLSSSDAGQTWRLRPTGLTRLRNASFTDALHGVAYDYMPTQLAVTADGGQTWSLNTPAGPMRRYAIQAIPGMPGAYLSVGPGYYAGPTDPAGTAISTDNGASWRTLEDTDIHSGLAVLNPTTAWAGGNYDSGTSAIARYAGTLLSTQAGRPSAQAFSAYPNPTTGLVQVPANAEAQRVAVYNTLGQLQLTLPLPGGATSFNLSSLPAGVYQVVMAGKTGTQSQRVVVVH
ncbi:MAG: hypothetical protein JWP58_4191 [Hymenobacter sp.]|nr:hypothetical protein [Hymenobacter sp.]